MVVSLLQIFVDIEKSKKKCDVEGKGFEKTGQNEACGHFLNDYTDWFHSILFYIYIA